MQWIPRSRAGICAGLLLTLTSLAAVGLMANSRYSFFSTTQLPDLATNSSSSVSPVEVLPVILEAEASGETQSPSTPPALESAPHELAAAGVLRPMPFAPSPDRFSLHKMGNGRGPTLLVVGGIQGDEPGGFSAASLLLSHYTIQAGSVWVVPDLNYASILERNRGIFGDMNRKFAALDATDPEYSKVTLLKSVLQDEEIDLVLNLHDGSGFYRPTWENALQNPNRWGQSVIIDQEELPGTQFSALGRMAGRVEADVNNALLAPEHRYHTRNTNTRTGDKEMEKSLSYFAVCNGKPAFGIEASKEFTTEYRSYYHVLAIESFMRQMGIRFTRNFPLTPAGVLAALNSDLALTVYEGKVMLPLEDVRPSLAKVPFKKGERPTTRATKPLLSLVPEKELWRVAYGNRTLTRLSPVFMDFDDSLQHIELVIDGKAMSARPGNMVIVNSSLMIKDIAGYRVNAIGAQKEKRGTEAGVELTKNDFIPRFSVDKSGKTYRVELYKGNAFAGMILVRFDAAM